MERLEIVKKILYEKNASLVVMFKEGEIKEFYNRRVIDIVSLLKENSDSLNGAVVADKVIGKAAASLFTVGRIKELYADTISEHALSVLKENNIKYEYKNKVDYIMNNQKSGMCPMEEKFKDEKDLKAIYQYFLNDYIL